MNRKKSNIVIVAITIILALNAVKILAQTSFTSSIVRVYGYKSGTIKMGTGSFVELNGNSYILTCYHNLSGCEKIEVFSSTFGKIVNIKIAAYDNVKDLILLTYQRSSNLNPINLQIGNIPNNLTAQKGVTIGHPNSITEQKFEVRFTSEKGFINSTALFDNSGKSIFKLGYDFNVIPIDLTIYGGMSGAPVILNSFIIGILSGSINTGGSIGWAIPTTYCEHINFLTTYQASGINLPELQSIKPENKNIFRSVASDESFTDTYYSPLEDVLNDIENSTDNYIKSLSKQNQSINSAIQKINSFDPNNAYYEKQQYLDGSQMTNTTTEKSPDYESILKYISAYENESYNSNSLNASITSDMTTFSSIQQQIINYNSEENDNLDVGIDSLESVKFQRKISNYTFQIQELQIKLSNKTNQKFSSSLNYGMREMNPAVLVSDCKPYLSLSLDENKYSIDFAKTKLELIRYLKIYVDLIYEAKGFTSN